MPLRLDRVFCLEETMWDEDRGLREGMTVVPILETLQSQGLCQFVHRHAPTRDAFDWLVERRRRDLPQYGLLYFAFHGTPLGLTVYDPDHAWPNWGRSKTDRALQEKHSVPLETLAELIGTVPGAIVHLGACSVLSGIDVEAGVREFLLRTQASLLSGFDRDVDWVESAAFDQSYLSYLTRSPKAALGPKLARFTRHHAGLAEELRFVAWRRRSNRVERVPII